MDDAGHVVIRSVRRRVLDYQKRGLTPTRVILDHSSYGCLLDFFDTAAPGGPMTLWGLRVELSEDPEHLEVA